MTDKVYTHHWQPGDALVCDKGTNFIPPGTVVVFDGNSSFAPFVNVLIPGVPRDNVGHFGQDSFRKATPDELHAAMISKHEESLEWTFGRRRRRHG